MCGICGVVGMRREGEAESAVRRMMAAMTHRGPDDEGMHATPGAVIGMQRLSIIDLAGGCQPIFNEAGTIAVVQNGEIYNFRELRAELEGRGHVFRTKSDTEVIVHAYEEWGEECAAHLRGMFAFAVVDTRRETPAGPRLLMARDPLGIKPLYYARVNGALVFASEVRALVASGEVATEISREGLESYLLFGSVAEPVTLVEGVRSLEPGHRMSVRLGTEAGEARPEAYWDFAGEAKKAAERSFGPTGSALRMTAKERVRERLEDAVRSHLVADVPVGIFLSSGMDSTAIAALASRERAGIHTFTVVFPEQEYSEAAMARRTAVRLGTRHEEMLLSGEDLEARLMEAVGALDQPTMDGVNTFFVSWAARQTGLKVALSGLGGDELFGGYSTFQTVPRAERLARVARRLPSAARKAAAAVAGLGNRDGMGDAKRKMKALWREPAALPHAYFFARALFAPEQAARLARRSSLEVARTAWGEWMEETAHGARELGEMAGVSCLEMRSYMVNTLLRDTDAVSMSQSLEVRVPLLDTPLVEFVAGLPEKAKRGAKKRLLREALGELLPEEVAGQKKRTFTFPWEKWLRGGLGRRVREGLEEPAGALETALDRKAVRDVWKEFQAGRTSWSRPWSLFVLNEWVRKNLKAAESNAEVRAQRMASG